VERGLAIQARVFGAERTWEKEHNILPHLQLHDATQSGERPRALNITERALTIYVKVALSEEHPDRFDPCTRTGRVKLKLAPGDDLARARTALNAPSRWVFLQHRGVTNVAHVPERRLRHSFGLRE
jgi:hypothetical protein